MAIFTNQATLSYNNIVTSSNIVQGEILEVLAVSKTAVNQTYTSNGTVTYVVSLTNAGSTTLTGLTLADDLGGYTLDGTTETLYPLAYVEGTATYYVNGILQADPNITADPPLTVQGISVPAGGNATLIYETRVTLFAPLGADTAINNTVTVGGPGVATPVTATETVAAVSEPRLSITKALTPTTVGENGQITYTFVIENTGNTPVVATDDATVTDVFNPTLDNLVVTFNGATWNEGANYTYNEQTGTFTTVPGQITVPEATYIQDPQTGVWTVVPGTVTLVVSGTI